MKNYLIIIIIFFGSTLFAQDSLQVYLKSAALNNPGLKAAYNKYMADLQKVPQVGSLPDPSISFGFFVVPMEVMNGNQVATIELMQMFPWFGTLKASKNEAATMALASYELFRQEKEALFYLVRAEYYQLFLNRKQIEAYDSTLELLQNIEQLLLSKLKTVNISGSNSGSSSSTMQSSNTSSGSSSGGGMGGMGSGGQTSASTSNASMGSQAMGSASSSSLSDLLRLQIEIKQLHDQIEGLKNREKLLKIRINAYLSRKNDEPIFIPKKLASMEFDFLNPAIFDSIKANNPMMKMNQADALAFQQRKIMNKKMSLPMVGVGLNYSVINKAEMSTSPMNGTDMLMPMLTVTLPIYRKKYNAQIKESELLETSANEQLANTENMLFMEFSEYKFQLTDANRKLKLYEEIVALTQQNLDLSVVQYANSGSDFDALLRFQQQLLAYKITLAELEIEKLTAEAGMLKLIAKELY